jgi:putative RNA 2'-phosphotransferase
MDEKQRVRKSKFLSKYLRHEPEAIGLTLEEGGWVPVEHLLAACGATGVPITPDELDEIVELCPKQRFAFDETGDRVRANQGHSVDVDLQLEPTLPPPVLYHGTPARFVPIILQEGLRKMARQHVHLSADRQTAVRVGSRRGKPVVLEVDSDTMARDGHVFFVSANGVWLTDSVPPQYLRLPEGNDA